MAYDACMMRCALAEVRRVATDAKVDRVCQPAADEIDLCLRAGRETFRLLINAGATSPRLAMTGTQKENPLVAPMFCMLLRKHLAGAHLARAEQVGFERVAKLVFSCYDEMGYRVERSLYAEIMGKYSNLIFVDENEKILAVLRPVDFTTSRKRQVLPGMRYELPPKQEKADPTRESEADFSARAQGHAGVAAEKYLTDTYAGLSRLTAREIVFRATGNVAAELDRDTVGAIARAFVLWFDRLAKEEFSPCLVRDAGGKPIEYSCFDCRQYEGAATVTSYASAGEVFDEYFGERDRVERIRQRAADLLRLLTSTDARLVRKLDTLREELAASEAGEEYRRCGDLITANIYRLARGMTSFTAPDYASEGMPEMTVALDERLTPAQNAQKYYKRYTKARNAKAILTEQIARAEEELRYIESVRTFLDASETESDLSEIREELSRAGYLAARRGSAPSKNAKSGHLTFVTDGGYRLLCGKNNLQNETITFSLAGRDDVWFHIKNMPGSHVVMITNGEEPGEKDYTQAAELAAYYSKAGGKEGASSLVTVDYTRVRNLKKPPHARPGFVIYKTNYSANVLPRLSVRKEPK